MLLLVIRCAEHITQLSRLKATGQGQRINPWIRFLLHISWTLQAIFINFHPNIPLSEIMWRTYDSATQTQCQVMWCDLCPLHISSTVWISFVKLHSYAPLSEAVCRAHESATLTQAQVYRSMSSDLYLNLVSVPYLLNPEVNFSWNFT